MPACGSGSLLESRPSEPRFRIHHLKNLAPECYKGIAILGGSQRQTAAEGSHPTLVLLRLFPVLKHADDRYRAAHFRRAVALRARWVSVRAQALRRPRD